MADKIYKPVTADDGTVSYVEITDANELPETLVKDTPQYKSVLDESVKRRKIIQDLKKPVVTNEDETEIVKPTEEKPVVTPPTPVLDKAALFAEFKAQLETETKAEKEAREQKQADLSKILADNGLSLSLMPALETSTDPATTAKLLAKSGYRFDDVAGGEVPSVKSSQVGDILANWKKKYAD